MCECWVNSLGLEKVAFNDNSNLPIIEMMEKLPTMNKRPYNDNRWRRLRKRFLYLNPVCCSCGGRADTVDHKTPWKRGKDAAERYTLFWDSKNLSAHCKKCHDSLCAVKDNKEFKVNADGTNVGQEW